MSLKSGSDIRALAYSETNSEVVLTNSLVRSITASFISFLEEEKNIIKPIIAVGYDSRLSSERIKSAVIESLLYHNIKTYDCGLSSTPAMFMTTINLHCDAAIMITASHMPYEMNGLKFFTKEGGLSGEDIEKTLKNVSSAPLKYPKTENTAEPSNHMDIYAAFLRGIIIKGVKNGEKPLAGLKIAVDAGNGVGGFYAKKVLIPLGANCEGSRFLEPDGYFPNHIPNPEDKDAMLSIKDAVVSSNSDFGVIFDTDVDRAACVDANGEEINKSRLVALSAAIALKKVPYGTIVTDSVTSDGVTEFITKNLGGVHHRFKRGYKNVIDEARRLENEGINAPLAIETSGHAAFADNYFLDDGAYLITLIITLLANMKKENKGILSLISDYREAAEEKEERYNILQNDFKQYGKNVIDEFEVFAKNSSKATICPNNFEGIRISFNDGTTTGWLLIRMSLHEPLLVMNCESDNIGGTKEILAWFYKFLEKFDKLQLKK
ncbi:MAG TPA: phosphomannomutase/phosphoglucomutase [Oscillospiraceae bacterium]|nr:phosphomannomutase/phosphoglucomutase [Oscillospiraceae bacterium]